MKKLAGWSFVAATLTMLAVVVPAAPAAAAAGDPDTTFGGGDGVASFDLGASNEFGEALAVQPDGGVVVGAGSSSSGPVVLRLTSTGSLDSAFDDDGVADLGGLPAGFWILDLTLDSQGRVLVAGGYNGGAYIARLTASGDPDTGFGGTGAVLFADLYEMTGVAAGPSDSAVGISARESDFAFVAVRLTSAGSADSTFDGDGRREVAGSFNPQNGGWSVAVESLGGVTAVADHVVANGIESAAVIRLTSGGANRPGWGSNGLVDVPVAGTESYFPGRNVLVLEPSGAVVVGGARCLAQFCSDSTPMLARLTPSGSLDPSFGTGGKFAIDTLGAGGVAALVRQPDGGLVVGLGLAASKVVRVLPSGALDPSWGTSGVAGVPAPLGSLGDITLAPSGDVVLTGGVNAPNSDVVVARLDNPQPVPAGGGSVAVPPARLLDTRNPGEGPCVSGPAGRNLTVVGVGGVPPPASSVTLNVTVTGPSVGGFLTVWPAGQPRPTASNLNFVAGQTIPNTVVAKVGTGGQISMFANAGCPHVIVDVVGWSAGGAPAAGGLTGVTPARLLDTREPGQGPCVSGVNGRNLTVTNVGGVPPSGVGAVALNVTVTGPSAGGFLTVWPAGQVRPLASNLNFVAGETIPNTVLATVGAGEQISIFANAGCPHVVVDVVGWFASGAPAAGGFAGLTPSRLLDTRDPGKGPCVSGQTPRNLTVTGVGGVPASGVGAVALNVTVTGPSAPGFVTVWPAGQSRPTTSNLNYAAGQTIPNTVIAKVGAGGQVSFFANAGCPHLVVDVVGWFASVPSV